VLTVTLPNPLPQPPQHRILVFNADGTKKHEIGGKGTGNGEFMSPKNIATSTNGKVSK
jgi:hypothetical protein